MKCRALLFAALAAVSAFGQTYKSVTLDQDGLLVAPTNLWSANAAGICSDINATVAPLLENVTGLQDALDGKLNNDGGAVYVESGTVIATDFSDGSYTFSSLFDGSGGVVNSAYYDENGSNRLSALFDGTGGFVATAGFADEGQTLSLASLFDGSNGWVTQATQSPSGGLLDTLFDGTAGYVQIAFSSDQAMYADDGFHTGSNRLSGLFDGTGGYTLGAITAAYDEVGNNPLSSLFDGSGGSVLYAATAGSVDGLNSLATDTFLSSDGEGDITVQELKVANGWIFDASDKFSIEIGQRTLMDSDGLTAVLGWGGSSAYSAVYWFDGGDGFRLKGDGSGLTDVYAAHFNDGSGYGFSGDGNGIYHADAGGWLVANELNANSDLTGNTFYFDSGTGRWTAAGSSIEAVLFYGDGGSLNIGEGVTISQLTDGTGGFVTTAQVAYYADNEQTQNLITLFDGTGGWVLDAQNAGYVWRDGTSAYEPLGEAAFSNENISSLFDGTGGRVETAINAWDDVLGYSVGTLSSLFDGSGGYVEIADKAYKLLTDPSGFTASETITIGSYPLITLAGTTAGQTLTLPAPVADVMMRFIKNRSSQSWTIAAGAGTPFYTSSAQATITIPAGGGATLGSDGTYWNVIAP